MGNGYNDKPISPLGYLGYEFLFGIPIVGLIIAIIMSIGAGNQNVKNFARAQIIVAILLFIIYFVAALLGFDILPST